MRPESMPKSFALKYSNGPSHIEVLNEMLGEAHVERIISPETEPRYAALTAAIAAMEALEKGVKVQVFGDSESGPRILHTPWNLIGQTVLILPVDAVGGG